MNKNDFNSFLLNNSIFTGNWKIYYNFSNITGGLVVLNELYPYSTQFDGSNIFIENNPGLIVGINTGGFEYNGSGFFSGDSILRLSRNIDATDWSIFMTYKNSGCEIDRNKSTILFSNQNNTSDLSGLCFGYNGANKFFIEYNDISGKNTYTSKYEGKNNTCFSLAKKLNEFELTIHDVINSEHTLEIFKLNNYINSNVYYLGNAYNTNNMYTGFKGYIDDFLYFSGFIGFSQRNDLAKGIFCSGINAAYKLKIYTGYNKISSSYLITGFILNSGITGYSPVSIGSIPRKNGGIIQIYENSGIIGPIYGESIIFETGSVTGLKVIKEINIPEEPKYDFVRLQNFSNNRLKLLYNIDSNDFVEINTYTGFLDNYRKVTQYSDPLQQFILGLESTGQNINLFSNGVLQISGTNISGNVVSGNYSLSGNRYVDSDLFFDQFNDNIVYFDITQTPQIIQYTGTGINYTLNNSLNNSMYLNGQKLISGLNYSINGSNIRFSGNLLATGQVLATARTNNIYRIYTGDFSQLTGNLIPLTEEQVYFNGILQINSQDYIKVSCQSLLNSLFYPAQKTYNYYNNEEASFNLL